MRRIQGIIALGLLPVVIFAFLVHAWYLGGSRNLLGAGVVLAGIAAHLSVFLYRRSRGQEGKFVTMRVGPQDDEITQQMADLSSVICATLLGGAAVFLPYM